MSNIDPRWGSWAQAPAPIPESEYKETYHCDVAIVGAGISGVACALRAAQNGLNVIVVEKFGKWSARGGNIGVLTSKYMRSRGYDNDLDKVCYEWVKRSAHRCDEEIVRLFLKNSGEAMDWLFDIVTGPEYGARPELQAAIYHGETFRETYGSHRFFDGPMAKKGLRPGAADCVYAMYTESVKLGVKYLFNCPGEQLLKEDGRVTGVAAHGEEGYVRVMADKGVVLATGDIGGNDEMCEDLAPLANRAAMKIYMPKGGNRGDGHRMGLWAGGAFEDGPFPLMIHPQAFHMANYCFLFVDQKGKRFMNEDTFIEGKTTTMLRKHMKYCWSIIDGEWTEKIPKSIPYGGGIFWARDHAPQEEEFSEANDTRLLNNSLANGNAVEADTLEELAEKMGVPVDTFLETVKRYNAMCAQGRDEDFGKRPELLFTIGDKPPYRALKVGPAVLAIVGGLKVGTDLGVRDENDESIPGLYAIGNAAGGRYGVDYNMIIPGNSNGSALTFGYLLGNILAE